MEFKDRLESFRISLGYNKQKDMAESLGISESYYSQFEGGQRKPSDSIIRRLVIMSNKPEEYWRYGVVNEKERLLMREDFKSLSDAIKQFRKIGMLEAHKEFQPAVLEVLIAAMKADVIHILEKEEITKEE